MNKMKPFLPNYPLDPQVVYFYNKTVVDSVLPEMISRIDPYWYQFPPMNPLWHGIIGFAIALLGIVGAVGNAMVIYIFCSTKTLRTPSNLLVVNLAFSDFLMMLTNSPTMVINSYYETWALGPLFCDLYGIFGGVTGNTSIWSMTFIALDRYAVIAKGINGKPMTIRGAIFRILLIWTLTVSWSLIPLFGWNRYVPEGNMLSCGTDYFATDWYSKSYVIIYATIAYFTPLFLIIYSYYFIVKTVCAHEKQMREQAKKMNVSSLRSNDKQSSAEMRLAKIALMTISLWFMAWTPYLVINFIGVFEMMKITPLFTIWGSVFAKANSVYNPIVYAISHPKYRTALYKKFPSLSCTPSPDEVSSTASEVTAIPEHTT
ncbi:rhodopsin [Halyomorpha halys]|uniref:rhodopsin n=1 Tax=Halyomorpha halys TaxID=286706 RepID=UPI0006D4D066|nr:rhodopsin-like isoform X1 [Halyomorpha halys]XP_014274076.1 rhodopsin-like isoform X2 [Halyomorpha halys]